METWTSVSHLIGVMFKGIVETSVNVDIMGMYEYLQIIDLHV